MNEYSDAKLRISLSQYNIVWEDKVANLALIKGWMESLAGKTDLLVLPEMCTTGFSMNAALLAEGNDGMSITSLKKWAKEYDMAVCGSFIATQDGAYYNRAFFLSDQSENYYDKRHLFRMGSESEIYSAGRKQLIFEHKGFNVCLLICYDLRFPIWARNVDNGYDVLIYMANWPKSRAQVWNALLTARAIENMSYVCAVNRVGSDGLGLDYSGDSKLIDAKGVEKTTIKPFEEEIQTVAISKRELHDFRMKFPVWKDSDKFEFF